MPPHLSISDRWHIITLLEQGVSARQVARDYSCTHTTVNNLIRLYNETGNVVERSGRGSSGTIPNAAREILFQLMLRYRRYTAAQLASLVYQRTNVSISERTIRRYRRSLGYHAVQDQRVPMLTSLQVIARYNFCVEQKDNNWHTTIFCDESLFRVDERGGVYWLLPGEDRPTQPVSQTWMQIQAWGAISYTGRSRLYLFRHTINAAQYIRILRSYFLPYYHSHRNHTMLHDNARSHSARATRQWLNESNINYYPNYPANSPELNAIEKVWSWMHLRVRQRHPTTQQQLERYVREAWTTIPQSTIQAYIRHQRTVVRAIIAARGGNITE
jgi:transposase